MIGSCVLIHLYCQELATYSRVAQCTAANTARQDECVPIHSGNIVVLGGRGVGKTALCQVGGL